MLKQATFLTEITEIQKKKNKNKNKSKTEIREQIQRIIAHLYFK